MNFQGFEVTPLGNATLQIIENKLKVSNIGASELDGVIIKIDGAPENYKVYFSEIPNLVSARGIIKLASLGKNGLDQIVTTSEQFEWYDPRMDKVLIGYNATLLPQKFNLVGWLNGSEVFNFEEDKDNPTPPDEDNPKPCIGIIIALIGVGVAIYAATKSTKAEIKLTHRDADGNVTGTTTGTIKYPEPFQIMVHNRNFIVDEVGIVINKEFNPPLSAEEQKYLANNYALAVTAAKINEFFITSIQKNASEVALSKR